MRAYGDPAPATLANAIAFVHITQCTRGLHMSTMSRLMTLYEFAERAPHYRFCEDALRLAEASPLWKAYVWACDNGYRIRTMVRHDMRSIQFWNPERETYASLNRFGDVFLYPETGKWGNRTQRFNPSKGEAYVELGAAST